MSLNVVFSQDSFSFPCKKIAPPRLTAELLTKLDFSTLPKAPDQMIAPPSPPVVTVPSIAIAGFIPKAELL